MTQAKLTAPHWTHLTAALLVSLLHVVLVAVLIRAFAPELGAAILRPATQAFDVAITAHRPPPPPPPSASALPQEAAAAAPAGRKAQPRAVAAPRPAIALAPTVAPPVAGTGPDDASGAQAAGQGTGAGGQGLGTGSGAGGSGSGGGAAKPVKIAGDIVSARDYPRGTRALRLGSAVTIALTVGKDGRVSGCRVVRASRDPEADRITCRLATERFRFRPARDDAGRPVAGVFGWQQRWFAP
jgi:protein TonB